MHNQGDSEDPKLNEIDEMKQEVQAIKYDILADIKKFREENVKRVCMLNNNLQYVTEEFLHKYKLNRGTAYNSYNSVNGSFIKEPDSPVAEAQDTNNAEASSGMSPAEPKGHKSLRKFRELCNNNKRMLKAITAFTFQDYAKLKEEASGNRGQKHQGQLTSSNSSEAVSNGVSTTSVVGPSESKKKTAGSDAGSGGQASISASEKHKMFEEFQKRLDFDIQMPFDDE
jgi:hypothetical protein